MFKLVGATAGLVVLALLVAPFQILGGIFGLVTGLAGGLFGLAAGLVATVFGVVVGTLFGGLGIVLGLVGGLFGGLFGLGAVFFVLALPLLIVIALVVGCAKLIAAAMA